MTLMRIREISSCANHGRTTIVLEDAGRHLTLTFYADREEARRLTREVSRSGCACHPIYDFVGGLLRAFEATPMRLVLDDVEGQGIGSLMVVRHGEAEVGIPCYPPDGLALALRSRVPIYATAEALAHAERAQPRSSGSQDNSDVRQWLQQVRPEDFSPPGKGAES